MGFAYHFARDPNRTTITLPVDLHLKNETRISISLDASKLLTSLSFEKDGATTHSQEGDPVATQLRKNLQSSFRISSIEKGGIPTPPHPPKPIDLPTSPQGYPITIPKHIPLPALPSDNPILTTRVALGKKLFTETKLSRDSSISCASCHQGETFSDPRKLSLGVDSKLGVRHSMPLFNLAWKSSFFWDGRAPSLRAQALVPIEDHLEMDESLENVVIKLKADPAYAPLFAAAFGSAEISPENIGLAIENFLLTRLSFDSKLDRSLKGEAILNKRGTARLRAFLHRIRTPPRQARRGLLPLSRWSALHRPRLPQ